MSLWIGYTEVDSVFRGFLSLDTTKFLPQQHCTWGIQLKDRMYEKNFVSALNCTGWSSNLTTQPKLLTHLLFNTIVLCTFLFPHSLPRLKSKQFQTFLVSIHIKVCSQFLSAVFLCFLDLQHVFCAAATCELSILDNGDLCNSTVTFHILFLMTQTIISDCNYIL